MILTDQAGRTVSFKDRPTATAYTLSSASWTWRSIVLFVVFFGLVSWGALPEINKFLQFLNLAAWKADKPEGKARSG
jgi:hypothetical protein